jgi:DNA-binding CsgD family transcriptional regulator
MLTRSLELALAADAHEHVARAYCNLGAGAAGNRLYAEADTQLRAGIAYSQDRDLDSWRVYMTAWLARSAEEQGRYAQAQRCVDDVLRQPHLSPVARIPALVVAAQLTMRRGGDPEPQLAQAWELALGTGEVQRLAPVAAARAEAAWLAGRTDALAAIVEEVWPLAVGHPRRWVLGELAWWAAVGGRPKPAPIPVAEPFARMLAGEWAAAAQAWVAVGCPLWQAIALASEPDQGVARAGLELLAELGAPAVQLALVRDRHARGLPVPRGPRGTTRTNAFRLTARELEVLTLVADGLTNAEIARRLFLSEKTVGHHVSAVLRKLGQPTRARAVGVALRSGVVRPR